MLGITLLVLAVMLAGCGGSSAVMTAASWPGITVFDDIIYVAAGSQVQAVEPGTTGAITIWKFPEKPSRNQVFYAAPAVDDDLVVVADYTNSIFALDRTTGTQKWVFTNTHARFIGGAVLGEDHVYAGAADGTATGAASATGMRNGAAITARAPTRTPRTTSRTD